ncbi:MAG TPA: bifunctional phosphopantothenoylcysteine decarboxylase/phosphopantothenate--cysteine ligase CoaBC, partial [Pyrinomonadaceae bacterium]|nr:bifunctional phosphopantothenoylcysteine decarboxylase/phosphopantothenate--cysteine ligase CoaBC [Pyrinomonadaceae bacterium]
CAAPVLIAPAMNTTMWQHPATARNLAQLRADGVRVVEPDAGEMACGTFGPGRLSEPEKIVAAALDILNQAVTRSINESRRDLSGERILITAGATREEIDPVRFISNRSSGRMGFALAESARARGAEVTIVAGMTTATVPAGVRLVRVSSTEEMHDAVMNEIKRTSVFIAAAAVSDYRPAERAAGKIKKSGAALTLTLEPTKDILAEVATHRHDGLLVIGFAAETDDVLRHAKDKMTRKQLDAIVANDVTQNGAGFDIDTNVVSLFARDRDTPIELPLMSKLAVAHRILDEVARLRQSGRN